MRSTVRKWLVFGTLATLGAAASATNAEMVFNGGFETGNFSGWSVPPNIFPPNSGAQIFGIAGGGGSEGTHYAALSSTNLRFISQVLPTTAGQNYQLTFWLRQPDDHPIQFQVRFEGQIVLNAFDPLPDAGWHVLTLPLHANINGSFIEFGQQSFPLYVYLDDVRVVPVPAPSAAAVLLMGGAAAAGRRRRT